MSGFLPYLPISCITNLKPSDEFQRDDDGDDFPSPGGNFPGSISLPESSFSLGGFRPVEAAEYFVDDPPELGLPRGKIYAKGQPGGWTQVASP